MLSTNQDIIIAVITVTILFFLFSVFTVSYFLLFRRRKKQHQVEMDSFRKEFEDQLRLVQVEVQESTYQHVARELHDNINQLLGSTKMLMNVTENNLPDVPETFRMAGDTLGKAIHEIRILSQSLDKDWLKQFNFLQNLYEEIARINDAKIIKATVSSSGTVNMSSEEQIILFRIVQEALQNALRHAQPSRLSVTIAGNEVLQVKVVNDGKSLPANFQGMGTNNMRHRAKLFGGSVSWQSVNNETIVTISLPLKQIHEH